MVFGPLIAEKLRLPGLPGLLGLLIGGAVIGPNIHDVLPSFAALESIGSIGVLYLRSDEDLRGILNLSRFRCRFRRVEVPRRVLAQLSRSGLGG